MLMRDLRRETEDVRCYEHYQRFFFWRLEGNLELRYMDGIFQAYEDERVNQKSG